MRYVQTSTLLAATLVATTLLSACGEEKPLEGHREDAVLDTTEAEVNSLSRDSLAKLAGISPDRITIDSMGIVWVSPDSVHTVANWDTVRTALPTTTSDSHGMPDTTATPAADTTYTAPPAGTVLTLEQAKAAIAHNVIVEARLVRVRGSGTMESATRCAAARVIGPSLVATFTQQDGVELVLTGEAAALYSARSNQVNAGQLLSGTTINWTMSRGTSTLTLTVRADEASLCSRYG